MFRKHPINLAQECADKLSWEFVVDLDVNKEESLSGGITTFDPRIVRQILYPPQPFPFDGPGRGGT